MWFWRRNSNSEFPYLKCEKGNDTNSEIFIVSVTERCFRLRGIVQVFRVHSSLSVCCLQLMTISSPLFEAALCNTDREAEHCTAEQSWHKDVCKPPKRKYLFKCTPYFEHCWCCKCTVLFFPVGAAPCLPHTSSTSKPLNYPCKVSLFTVFSHETNSLLI